MRVDSSDCFNKGSTELGESVHIAVTEQFWYLVMIVYVRMSGRVFVV